MLDTGLDTEVDTDYRAEYRAEYRVNDIWCAAFLDLWRVPLVRVQPTGPRGSTWYFDNTGDQAWKAASLFRSATEDQVPIKAYRQSFRRVSQAGDAARRGDSTDGHRDR